ncbi:unnamed protein product [Leptosia nina]|uniref:Uncharacterized protein n=1 Tax=Leptosia nina TaxID=320188 RepID=A0AAV1K2I2_9NEOP
MYARTKKLKKQRSRRSAIAEATPSQFSETGVKYRSYKSTKPELIIYRNQSSLNSQTRRNVEPMEQNWRAHSAPPCQDHFDFDKTFIFPFSRYISLLTNLLDAVKTALSDNCDD